MEPSAIPVPVSTRRPPKRPASQKGGWASCRLQKEGSAVSLKARNSGGTERSQSESFLGQRCKGRLSVRAEMFAMGLSITLKAQPKDKNRKVKCHDVCKGDTYNPKSRHFPSGQAAWPLTFTSSPLTSIGVIVGVIKGSFRQLVSVRWEPCRSHCGPRRPEHSLLGFLHPGTLSSAFS